MGILELREMRGRVRTVANVDRVPDELWNEVCDIVQETGIKPRSPALQADSLPSEPPRKPNIYTYQYFTPYHLSPL